MSRLEEALKRSGTGGCSGRQSEPPRGRRLRPSTTLPHPTPRRLNRPPPCRRTCWLAAPSGRCAGDPTALRPADLSGDAHDGPGPVATAAGVAEKVVVDAETNPASVEQYRRLAAVLHHAQNERGIKRDHGDERAARRRQDADRLESGADAVRSPTSAACCSSTPTCGGPSVHQLFALPSLSGLSDGLPLGGRPQAHAASKCRRA